MTAYLIRPVLGRRRLMKATALASAVVVAGWSVNSHAAELFDMGAPELEALAQKVIPELPPAVCNLAVQALSEQIGAMTSPQSSSTGEHLQLLHMDDVINGRTHDIHGIAFSITQIGVLAAILNRHNSAA